MKNIVIDCATAGKPKHTTKDSPKVLKCINICHNHIDIFKGIFYVLPLVYMP